MNETDPAKQSQSQQLPRSMRVETQNLASLQNVLSFVGWGFAPRVLLNDTMLIPEDGYKHATLPKI